MNQNERDIQRKLRILKHADDTESPTFAAEELNTALRAITAGWISAGSGR